MEQKKEASAEIYYKKEIVPVKGPEKKVGYFPLGQVRLKEGTLYYKYQKLMEEYLLGIDDDQMLYNFRKATRTGYKRGTSDDRLG